ncbi:MAG: hypothetical protein ACRCTS_02895 [Fusobacteriaceae bacterium]
MKKILLVGAFVLSALSFANMHGNKNMKDMKDMGGMNCPMMGGMGKGMMGGMMMNMTPEQKMAMEKDMIAIQEKHLEVRKLMNTENPDMKKVEALNVEIGTMRTKHMESMHKMMKAPAVPAKTN